MNFFFFRPSNGHLQQKLDQIQRAEAVSKKIQNFDIFFKADPPANTSTVQKYGPGSNGAGQDMTWPQLSPKQLVSISHATSDLIRGPGRIQLSVFNPKPLNRHANAQEMKTAKIKCLQMNQNQCRCFGTLIRDFPSFIPLGVIFSNSIQIFIPQRFGESGNGNLSFLGDRAN